MSFLYPFLNFLQPGIVWPDLAVYKPMLVASLLALLSAMIGSRKLSPRPRVLAKSTMWWMIAFVMLQGLSMYRSGGKAMLDMLGFWYIYPVFVVLSVLLMRDEKALQRYVWGMLVGSMFVVAWGIWAKYSGYNSVIHPGEPYSMDGRAGAYGMYRNQNDYSFIIVQIVPFLYLFWRTERSFVRRILLLASLLTCVIAMMLCLSRGGMLALVLEFFLILVLTMSRGKVMLLLPLALIVAGAGIGYQWKMRAENQAGVYTYAESKDTRLQLWHAARVMIEDNPLLGVGSRSFGEHAKHYITLSHDDLGKNAHNTYLDIAATSGLTGLLCFMVMIWTAWKRLRLKPRKSGPPSDRLEAIRVAALITLFAILFRGLMDAKETDWSFYTLVAIAMGVEHLFRIRALVAVRQSEPSLLFTASRVGISRGRRRLGAPEAVRRASMEAMRGGRDPA